MPDTGEFESMLILGVGAGMWDLAGGPPFLSGALIGAPKPHAWDVRVYSEC